MGLGEREQTEGEEGEEIGEASQVLRERYVFFFCFFFSVSATWEI